VFQRILAPLLPLRSLRWQHFNYLHSRLSARLRSNKELGDITGLKQFETLDKFLSAGGLAAIPDDMISAAGLASAVVGVARSVMSAVDAYKTIHVSAPVVVKGVEVMHRPDGVWCT
jgi:hypothetical protein